MRKRLYEIIEISDGDDKASGVYDFMMLLVIILSIVPLWSHENNKVFDVIDTVTVVIFIIDYAFRWFTADIKLKRGAISFLVYPFSFMALIDLISILPSISIMKKGFRLFKIVRLLRTLKVFRVFKAFRYSRNISLITNVFKKQKDSLMVVCWFSIAYIIVSALVIFNAEPETFTTMFDAIYWATVSLTTVGYGDLYATSRIGKAITMVSAVLGIAIVALPAGIIVSGYHEELLLNQKEMLEKLDNEDKSIKEE